MRKVFESWHIVAVAGALLAATAPVSASNHPIGKITPAGKINPGTIFKNKPSPVLPYQLEARHKGKNNITLDTWGTDTSSTYYGNNPYASPTYPADYDTVIPLRYHAGLAKVPGTLPITIEASDTPTFTKIIGSKLLKPTNGIINAHSGDFGLYVVKNRQYTGQSKTWYLRIHQDAKVSNTVTVAMGDPIH